MNTTGAGGARRGQEGSAVVDFVLVSLLVVALFLGLVQLTLVLHVRNTVADAAGAAARYGALADRTAQDALDRAELLVTGSLGGDYAQHITAARGSVDGVSTLTVTIRTPLPLLGLWGPQRTLELSGHAVVLD